MDLKKLIEMWEIKLKDLQNFGDGQSHAYYVGQKVSLETCLRDLKMELSKGI